MAEHPFLVGKWPSSLPEDTLVRASKLLRELLPIHAQLDGGPEPISFRADVIPPPLEPQAVHALLPTHESHSVGELILPSLPGPYPFQVGEDLRLEHIAPYDREVRRCLVRVRLLHEVFDLVDIVLDLPAFYHAVSVQLRLRDLLHAYYTLLHVIEYVYQLPDARLIADDDVVS